MNGEDVVSELVELATISFAALFFSYLIFFLLSPKERPPKLSSLYFSSHSPNQ